jgi:hypothetical protein
VNIEARRCGSRKGTEVPPVWFFRWGFGVWLGTFIFSIGHDTRGTVQSTKR